MTNEYSEPPLQEAVRLTKHLRELLRTGQAGTSASISHRYLPVVTSLLNALELLIAAELDDVS